MGRSDPRRVDDERASFPVHSGRRRAQHGQDGTSCSRSTSLLTDVVYLLRDEAPRSELLQHEIMPAYIPITVFTGFLGAGKTSIILSLLPKLPKDYKVVLLKNEFGDIEGRNPIIIALNKIIMILIVSS